MKFSRTIYLGCSVGKMRKAENLENQFVLIFSHPVLILGIYAMCLLCVGKMRKPILANAPSFERCNNRESKYKDTSRDKII